MTTAALKLSKERRVQLLLDSRNLLLKNCQLLFARFQQKTVDSLNRFSPNVFAELDYQESLPLVTQWQEQTSAMRKYFLAQVADTYSHFARGELRDRYAWEQAEDRPGISELESLEEDLALANMVNKALAHHQEALYSLDRRFAVLANGLPVSDLSSPASPAVFAGALQRALRAIDANTADKLLIYKLFDTEFMATLAWLYDSLNEWMELQGILTSLHVPFTTDESTDTAATLIATTSLRQQINEQYTLQPADPDACFTVAELVKVLSGLQSSNFGLLESNAHAPDAQSIRTQIARHLGFDSLDYVYSNLVTREHALNLELINRLFDELNADTVLAPTARDLLSYLHVPYLKLALLEPDFLENSQHAAVVLLNELSTALQLWVDAEDRGQSGIIQEARQVVRRLLGDFQDDPRLFTELAFQFKSFTRAWRRRVQMSEKRAIQAAQGEDKLLATRRQVHDLLIQKLRGYELDTTIETLLFDPWLNFMAFTLLRYGQDSRQWQECNSVVDTVLLVTYPFNEQNDIHRRELQLARDAAVVSLRQGCRRVGYDEVKTERLLAHLLTFPGAAASNRPTSQDGGIPLVQEVYVDRPPSEQEQLLLDEACALPLNGWFEICQHPQIGKKNLKLAWRNPASMNYMFVNRLGKRDLFIGGKELAGILERGELKSLPEPDASPFLERGIQRLLAALASAQ